MVLPVESGRFVPTGFGASGEEDAPQQFLSRIRRTIIFGCLIAGVFVVGVGCWAAVTPLTSSVSAIGVVKVEGNRKTIKHLEPGVIQQILVHEGDHVSRGQLLFVFDEVQAKAQLDEFKNAYDVAVVTRARFEAEATGRATIEFPKDILQRLNDPAAKALVDSQRALFLARRQALQSQLDIGQQRIVELNSQIVGIKAQVAAAEAQLALNKDELSGVETLFSGGYAPKTRVLALQRSAASLQGSRGELMAAVAKAEQSIGETRMQIVASRQARTTEAAAGLQEVSAKLADLAPRLAAAQQLLSHSKVYAPVDGVVLNLTQFTQGGVAAAGEELMDIVPSGDSLVIKAEIQPRDAHAVRPGQKASITLTAYNTRTTPKVDAEVTTLSADQVVDPRSGRAYFTAELKIPPAELKRLPATVKIYPGMPVAASIVNGERTVMQYLLSPIHDAITSSMHEQ